MTVAAVDSCIDATSFNSRLFRSLGAVRGGVLPSVLRWSATLFYEDIACRLAFIQDYLRLCFFPLSSVWFPCSNPFSCFSRFRPDYFQLSKKALSAICSTSHNATRCWRFRSLTPRSPHVTFPSPQTPFTGLFADLGNRRARWLIRLFNSPCSLPGKARCNSEHQISCWFSQRRYRSSALIFAWTLNNIWIWTCFFYSAKILGWNHSAAKIVPVFRWQSFLYHRQIRNIPVHVNDHRPRWLCLAASVVKPEVVVRCSRLSHKLSRLSGLRGHSTLQYDNL